MFHNYTWQWNRARIFLVEKFDFLESKNFFYSALLHDKKLIIGRMLGLLMGHRMQQTGKI